MPAITPKITPAAPLKKAAPARLTYAEQTKIKAQLLADAYNKAAASAPAKPQPQLGMGDHAFWSNPASYWKMADASFWRNSDSYRGHGR
jgi:hypothetical protein